MSLSNPYIAGNPVQGQQQFVGREDIARDVERVLRNPGTNGLALFGQRRIGKTSLLLFIERSLAVKQEFTPVYFDLQDKAAFSLAEILYQLAQRIALALGCPAPERRSLDPDGRFFRDAFMRSALAMLRNQGLVLLFDEFDVFDIPGYPYADAPFFVYLREWMATTRDTQFIFVLGRRAEELSSSTLAAFKAILCRKISLMTREDSLTIICQSERDGSVYWSREAVEWVWYWTRGHPFFTQLLCREIWDALAGPCEAEDILSHPPTVTAEDVDDAIEQTLEQAANQLLWVWNDLPPSEQMVMAAMAEIDHEIITPEDLCFHLRRHDIRSNLDEFALASETLARSDMLTRVGNGFCFKIPLLRQWIVAEKPLRRVKSDVEYVEPLAESLYRSGEGLYKLGEIDEAERQLRNALNVDPQHVKALLLLGQILLGQHRCVQAVEMLELAYAHEPRLAKSGLLGALLALADAQQGESRQRAHHRILQIAPYQEQALRQSA